MSAASDPISPPPWLVGRAEELAAVRDLLAHATLDGACLVLSGEPGIGKTALLDEAQRLAGASGFRVLRAAGGGVPARPGVSTLRAAARRAAGVEFLAARGFSTLSPLLQPVQSLLSELQPAQRNALGSMLGLGG